MIGPEKFRVRGKIGRFTGVDQSEVASIVGMSSACAARWLAAGDMPWRQGQEGKISMPLVVELLINFELSKMGSRPGENRTVVGEAIAPVFYNAFCYADHSLEVTGMPDDVDWFSHDFAKSTALACELTGGPHTFSCLYKCPKNQEFYLAQDLTYLFNKSEFTKIPCLDFRELAFLLCSRVRRSLLSVELVHEFPSSRATGRWLSTGRRYH